jgi:hypothetical protein
MSESESRPSSGSKRTREEEEILALKAKLLVQEQAVQDARQVRFEIFKEIGRLRESLADAKDPTMKESIERELSQTKASYLTEAELLKMENERLKNLQARIDSLMERQSQDLVAPLPVESGSSSFSDAVVLLASRIQGQLAEHDSSVIHRSGLENKGANYTVCSQPFFMSLATAVENGSWLEFMNPLPDGLKLKRLYIRECYRFLADEIICDEPLKKTIITGTPGVGKSVFLIYLLWKLVTSKKRVIFVYNPHSLFFDGIGGVFETTPFEVPRNGQQDPSNPQHPLWTADTYCLFDSKEMQAQLAGVPYNLCPFVYARSPCDDSTNELQKADPNLIVNTYYMPRWSNNEISEVSILFPRATQWEECLEIYGPIPRLVFKAEGTVESAKKVIESVAVDDRMINLIYEVGQRSAILGERKSVVHKAVHYMSETPYDSYRLVFASDHAIQTCFDVHRRKIRERWNETITAYTKNSFTGQICGYAFQEHALNLLRLGGEFHIHQLLPNGQNGPEETLLIHQSPNGIIHTDSVRQDDEENVLHVPHSKRYPDIDAWIPGVGGIQITINLSHEFKGNQFIIDSLKLGNGKGKLYWAIPQQHYAKFKGKRGPGVVFEYAMKIPDPHDCHYENAKNSHLEE